LGIKVTKHSKNERPFSSSYSQLNTQTESYTPPKPETILKEDKSKDKGKGIVMSSLRSLMV